MIRKNSRTKTNQLNPSVRALLRSTLCLALCMAMSVAGYAQLNNPERLGLTTVWTKAAGVGAGGEITGVHLHVSPKNVYSATEIVDRLGRRQFFADNVVPVSRAGYDQTQRLTDLRKADLETLGLDPRVEQHSFPEATLYVRSSSGTVTALDAETGQLKWSTQAGTAGYPSHSVAATDDYVVAISSTTLYLLDAQTGQVLETSSTSSIPSGTPTMDGDLVYVPMWKGLIEVFSTDNFGRTKFTMGATSRIVGTVTIGPDVVSWASKRGDLYVGNRKGPGLKYRFQSPDNVASAPAFYEGSLFATSLDGFVYAISDTAGQLKWRYAAGGPISESPLVVDGTVLAISDDGQLVSLDAETGDLNWSASNVRRFVSASKSRLYCATRDARLVVIDTATGARIGSQQMGRNDVSFVNTNTDRLYLASASGTVRCLRESNQRWPVVRQVVLDPVEEPEMMKMKTAEPESVSPSAGDEPPTDQEEDVFSGAEPDGLGDAEDESDPFEGFGDDSGDDDAGFGDDGDEDPFEDF